MNLHQSLGDIANHLTQLALERPDPALGIIARRLLICATEALQMRRTIDEYETDAAEDAQLPTLGCEHAVALAELNAIVAAQGRPKV